MPKISKHPRPPRVLKIKEFFIRPTPRYDPFFEFLGKVSTSEDLMENIDDTMVNSARRACVVLLNEIRGRYEHPTPEQEVGQHNDRNLYEEYLRISKIMQKDENEVRLLCAMLGSMVDFVFCAKAHIRSRDEGGNCRSAHKADPFPEFGIQKGWTYMFLLEKGIRRFPTTDHIMTTLAKWVKLPVEPQSLADDASGFKGVCHKIACAKLRSQVFDDVCVHLHSIRPDTIGTHLTGLSWATVRTKAFEKAIFAVCPEAEAKLLYEARQMEQIRSEQEISGGVEDMGSDNSGGSEGWNDSEECLAVIFQQILPTMPEYLRRVFLKLKERYELEEIVNKVVLEF